MKVSSLLALLATLMMSQAAFAADEIETISPQQALDALKSDAQQVFGRGGGGGGMGGGGFHGGGMGGGFHGGGGMGGGGFHPGGGFGGGGFHPGGGGFGGGHPGGGMGGGFHGPRPGPVGPGPAPGGGFHGPRPGPVGPRPGPIGPRPGPVGPVHGPGHGGNPGWHGPGHGGPVNPGHGGWHGPSRGSRSPVRFHGGGYSWRHWSHAWSRPVFRWNWPLVRTVTCTAEDSVGYDYPVTETGYVGVGYQSRIEQIEDAALDRCYEETNGDEGCQLIGCTASY